MPSAARAGAQQYEPMADAVRVALAAQIADPKPPARRFEKIEERIAYLAWVAEMSERLGNKVGDYSARVEFLKTLDYEATAPDSIGKWCWTDPGRKQLSQVCDLNRRRARTDAGDAILDARDRRRRVAPSLFDAYQPAYGTVILRHYLDIERGDLFMALGRYNGSRGGRRIQTRSFQRGKIAGAMRESR